MDEKKSMFKTVRGKNEKRRKKISIVDLNNNFKRWY